MLTRATTEVQAANGALNHIGEPAIADMGLAKASAIAVRGRFADVRDGLLCEHDWNFAKTSCQPASNPALDASPFTYAYPMPGDCLTVLSVEGLEEDSWESGAVSGLGHVLKTDSTAPKVYYTRIVAPDAWSPLFLLVFQLRLAVDIAPRIGRDPSRAAEKLVMAERQLMLAKRVDSKEKARGQIPRVTSWSSVRW